MNDVKRDTTQNQLEPVYLVGAGPGDPGLLTIRGLHLIETADYLVYDYLSNDVLLSHAPSDCECIYVGKKGFSQHVTQDQINACLVDLAREHRGSRIVRLKGGDPFVFGRGGEEAEALVDADISFEVVPGVTSGIAAPAYAGIPVTHRGCSASVAFVTGHRADGTDDDINWDALAKGVDTLCFYMGIRSLPTIARNLMDAGRDSSTPAALIRWGTMPSQEVLVSTLGNIVDDAERARFAAPAIIVVGDVVSLRSQLAWYEKRSLHGRRITLTRPAAQNRRLANRLRELGAEVEEVPTIRIEPIASSKSSDALIRQTGDADWVVFTSRNGVECFFSRLEMLRLDARVFGSALVACIGTGTAEALEDHGIRADLIPDKYVAESLADALIKAGAAGKRIFIPRASAARETLVEMLEAAGAKVDVLPLYRTELATEGSLEAFTEKLSAGLIDAVTFTSASTVEGMKRALGPAGNLLENTHLISIGPITSKTLRDHGYQPYAEACTYDIPGLIEALVDVFDDAADVHAEER